MTASHSSPSLLAAVDLGNTATKIAIAESIAGDSSVESGRWRWASPLMRVGNEDAWNGLELPHSPLAWIVSSVQSRRRQSLQDWIARERPADRWIDLSWHDVPIGHDVAAPERVGMDRWMGAVAAAKRWGDRASGLVVLAGTAITVNLIREGVFAGGAILPGFDLTLSALHRGTDRLPDLVGRLERLEALPGRDTEAAIYAGVGWGTVGAVREIGSRLTTTIDAPRWILSGGAADMLAEGLGIPVEIVEPLTLEGALETYFACGSEATPIREAGERDDRV